MAGKDVAFHLERPWADAGHEDIGRYIDETTVSVDDIRLYAEALATGMAALAQLAGTFFPALDSSLADRKQLNDRVTAMEKRAAQTLNGTTGQLTKNLTLNALGGTTTFGVTFANPMPSANYIPLVSLDASSVSLLGNSSVVYPITNKTAFGCTVTVRNTALLTVASSVTVYVAALALT